jgi:hypothetical protein
MCCAEIPDHLSFLSVPFIFFFSFFFLSFGGDSEHFNAVKDFDNMDKVLAYINANSSFGVTVKYAVLSEFFDALAAENITWPTRNSSDFMPYAR